MLTETLYGNDHRKEIKQMVSDFPDDFVFVASDLDCEISQRDAAARALQRMAERGEI